MLSVNVVVQVAKWHKNLIESAEVTMSLYGTFLTDTNGNINSSPLCAKLDGPATSFLIEDIKLDVFSLS